jgi:hypothetical protein
MCDFSFVLGEPLGSKSGLLGCPEWILLNPNRTFDRNIVDGGDKAPTVLPGRA